MKALLQLRNILFLAYIIPGLFLGCDVFVNNGNSTSLIGPGGYFYITDKASNSIIMLDSQVNEVKRWSLYSVTPEASTKGITFDGKNIWVSISTPEFEILKLDLSGDSIVVVKTIKVSPATSGTIEGIAWDGVNLWAVNEGSSSLNIAPSLYKIDPSSGTISYSTTLPDPSPRGLTYSKGYTDVYGRSLPAGLYFTDKDKDKIYYYNTSIPFFDTVFSAIVPPRGSLYVYETGITFDGQYFWIINSSSTADHLFKVSYTGTQEARFDLPYNEPGSIVWTSFDVRVGSIISVAPGSGALGETINVDIQGTGFKQGLTVDFGSGITIDSVSFISGTEVKAKINISSSAVLGNRNITISNPNGVSIIAKDIFQVTAVHTEPYLWLIVQDITSTTIDTLYQIRISDSTIVKKWSTAPVSSQTAQGIAFDGTHFWINASGTDKKIYQVDTTSSSLVASNPLPAISGTNRGLCWYSNDIYEVSSDTSKGLGRIIRFDPVNKMILDTILSPGIEPRGIVFADGNLYCNDKNTHAVYEYNYKTQAWTLVFNTPIPPGGSATSGRFETGLTWDGSNFWMANSTGNYDFIYKISKTGTVLKVSPAPRLGPGVATGLVYTSN